MMSGRVLLDPAVHHHHHNNTTSGETTSLLAASPSCNSKKKNKKNDDDDDSHTTLGDPFYRGGGNASCSSSVDLLQEEDPSPTMSPASQTLHVLSQHDARGGGDLRYDMSQLKQDHAAVQQQQQQQQNQSPPKPQQQDVHNNNNNIESWNVDTLIVLSEPGSLGLDVTQGLPDHVTTSPSTSLQKMSFVANIQPGSQAHVAGVQVGDVLCRKTSTDRHKEWIDIDTVEGWGKGGPRPVEFRVARRGGGSNHKRVVVTKNEQAPSVRSTTNQDSTKNKAPPSHNDDDNATLSSQPSPSNKNTTNKSSKQKSKKEAATDSSKQQSKSSKQKSRKEATMDSSKQQSTESKATSMAHLASEETKKTITTTTTSEESSSLRPIDASANDKVTSAAAAKDKSANGMDKPTLTTESNLSMEASKETGISTQTEVEKEEGEIVVPFCKACKKVSRCRVHHALCPKHPQFAVSGAREKLALILQGVRKNCPACLLHYERGSIPKGENNNKVVHLDDCERSKGSIRQKGKANKAVSSNSTTATETIAADKTQSDEKETVRQKNAPKPNGSSKKGQQRSKTATKKKDTFQDPRADDVRLMENPLPMDEDKGTDALGAPGHQVSSPRATTAKVSASRAREVDSAEAITTASSQSLRQDPRNPRSTGASDQARTDRVARRDTAMASSLTTTDHRPIKKRPRTSRAGRETADPNAFTKATWVPAENPWGKSGYLPGDVVFAAPDYGFASPDTVTPQERFETSPFLPNSCYRKTHQLPSEGLDVLQLTRDMLGKNPWGFTCRKHVFGGACLVRSVDPSSPAANAVYRGFETEETGGAGLRLHDMILAINGQSVGGMTALGLAVELSVCGPEVQLVVSRYKYPAAADRQAVLRERHDWDAFDRAVNDDCRLDWYDVDMEDGHSTGSDDVLPDSDMSPITFRYGDSRTAEAKNGQSGDDVERGGSALDVACDIMLESHNNFSLSGCALANNDHGKDRDPRGDGEDHDMARQQDFDPDSGGNSNRKSDDWENDDEAWLGCVCGQSHSEPIPVFWVQCDECDAWYNVSSDCVGFSEEEAQEMDRWVCAACLDSVGDCESSQQNGSPARMSRETKHKPSSKLLARKGTGKQQVSGQHQKGNSSSVLNDRPDPSHAQPTSLSWMALVRVAEMERAPEMLDEEEASSDGELETHEQEEEEQEEAEESKVGPAPLMDDEEASLNQQSFTDNMDSEDERSQRWTDDGCFLPRQVPRELPDGSFARPTGRCPRGLAWDASRGLYAPEAKSKRRATTRREHKRKEAPPVPEAASEPEAKKRKPTTVTPDLRPVTTDTQDLSARLNPLPRSRWSNAERRADKERRMREGGCLAPAVEPVQLPDGTYAKPTGTVPKGMCWDAEKGLWAPKVARSTSPNRSNRKKPERDGNHPVERKEEAKPTAAVADELPASKKTTHVSPRLNPLPRSRWSKAERQADKERRMREGGCLAPAMEPVRLPDGTFAKPPGSVPKGMFWDDKRGLWAPTNGTRTSEPSRSKKEQDDGARLEAETSRAVAPPAAKVQGPSAEAKRIPERIPRSQWTQAEREADIKKRLTADGCLAPASKPRKLRDGTFSRPLGRDPKGMNWDAVRGIWAPTKSAALKKSSHERVEVTDTDDSERTDEDAAPHISVGQSSSISEARQENAVQPSSASLLTEPVGGEAESLPLPVGTVVEVAKRTGKGFNKEGGVGRIMDYERDEGNGAITYNVSYVIGGGRESGIPASFVKPHTFIGLRSSGSK